MSSIYRIFCKGFCALVLSLCAAFHASASHIYGVDLFYTHVSGNTYTVSLVVYGDCSGAAFTNLQYSTPQIGVYNGNTLINNFNLAVQTPSTGLEVTPVCPAQAGNTQCINPANPLPGIKKFVYSGTVSLPGTSSVWRFMFSGNMGGTYLAGRSTSITNIAGGPSSTLIQLVDTLNNVGSPNSSSVYTTIATPFFCINSPSNYNPGAVDPDGDNLVFALVPGMDATTGGSVTYGGGYSATLPLAVAAGTFSFSSTTGQMSFTPNITQKSLVVYNVEEFRSGVLKGTSQREMCMVVLSPCSNIPPNGTITGASAGSVTGGTNVNICNSVDSFNFQINPTDPEGDSITMTATGLPPGSAFTIIGNNTTAPHGTFHWNAAGVAPGTYSFYISYQDNGCPLAGHRIIAYTITVLPAPSESVVVLSLPNCTNKGFLHITPGGATSPWTVNVMLGSTTIQSFTGVTGMLSDSLLGGVYTIRTYNNIGCYRDTSISMPIPIPPSLMVNITPPICAGTATGIIVVTGYATAGPFVYAIGSGGYSTVNTFSGLSSGTYTLHIRDESGCTKDTILSVPNPTPILLHISKTKPLCNVQANGVVLIQAYNSLAPYSYSIGAGSFSTNDTFSALSAGTYMFHIANANGCILDTAITLVDSTSLSASVSIMPILCHNGTSSVTVTAIGGFGPSYTYACNAGGFGPFNTFSLSAGTYTLHVHDMQSCFFDTTIGITQPTAVVTMATVTNTNCYAGSDGTVVLSATGGTPAYHYSVDGGAFTLASTFTGLAAGTHIFNLKDANNCNFPDTVIVGQPTAISADSVKLVKPSCYGGSNGSLHIYASGGTPGYTYAINTGAFGASALFSGLAANTYTIHIKDTHNCIKDTVVTLGQPLAITPSVTLAPSKCATLANGQAIILASGGTPSYTYAIGTGTFSSINTFSPLAAGTYTLHIKDADNCVKDTIIHVVDSMHISGIFTITRPLCHNDSNGTIVVNGAGGYSPYTIAFGGGAFSSVNSFTGLAAGTYPFHIHDTSGCIADTTVVMSQPTVLAPVLILQEPFCHGTNNGAITVGAAGGTPSYLFSLNGSVFSTTALFSGLSSGLDTIVIRDINGCLKDTVVALLQPTGVDISNIAMTPVSCHGGGDGTITVTASGAVPPYTYAANGSVYQVSNVLTGLSAGAQLVSVKDSHGCTFDTTVVVAQPLPLIFTGADTVNPTCKGSTDGSVSLWVSGGTLPYHFSTDNVNFSGSPVFSGLSEGTYSFIVKDGNGCIADTTISLFGFPHILFDSLTVTNVTCAGYSDGQIKVVAGGGVPPFNYVLSGPNVDIAAPGWFEGMQYGHFHLTVTDSRGCYRDTTLAVLEPEYMAMGSKVTPNECLGSALQGTIVPIVNGGIPPYTYLWSTGATSPVLAAIPNGDYMVWVRDANNCVDSFKSTVGFDDCCTPYVPNAFSPNNDGRNDIFRVKYKGDVKIIEFSIFNRFGERIFSSSYSDAGWDGTYDGRTCDIGSYFYYIRLICGKEGDQVLEFKGDVTLVR